MTIWPVFLLTSLVLVVVPLLPSASADDIATIKERGALRVGVSGDYQPFSLCADNITDCRGFDVEVAQRVATDLGVALELARVRTVFPNHTSLLRMSEEEITPSVLSLEERRQLGEAVWQIGQSHRGEEWFTNRPYTPLL